MKQLPEKWCIKTDNDENGIIIGRWFNYQSYNICYTAEDILGGYYHSYNYINQNILIAGKLASSFSECCIREGFQEITFEQFKKLVLKQNDMENKSIKINIPEGMEIDKEKSTFEEPIEIVFKTKEKKLPKSWEELKKIKGYYINSDSQICIGETYPDEYHKNIFPTKELAEASKALAQLLQLRDIYNDGWTPDWCDTRTIKNVIIVYKNQIQTDGFLGQQAIFAFKDMEVRDEFYNNFISLLQIAKPLL